jgi:dipeptidase D
MRNAIPFKAETVLTLPADKTNKLIELVEEWKNRFEHEYQGIENSIEFYAEDVECPANITPVEIQDNLIDAIYACPNGVVRMIPAIPEVVETSSNLAIVNIADGKAAFKILARSSSESMKDYIATSLESCFSMAGMKVTLSGSYGGWDPNTDSEILNLLKKLYKKQNNEEPVIKVDHAGLECSVILDKYPGLDIVSMGPTIRSPHTTNERCLISSVALFWELIKEVLAEIPNA